MLIYFARSEPQYEMLYYAFDVINVKKRGGCPMCFQYTCDKDKIKENKEDRNNKHIFVMFRSYSIPDFSQSSE